MAAPWGNQSSSSPEKHTPPDTCCQPFSKVRVTVGHFNHQPHNNAVTNTDIYAQLEWILIVDQRRIKGFLFICITVLIHRDKFVTLTLTRIMQIFTWL